MKKPKRHVENSQPRDIQRADIAPSDGYALVVDGHFKTQFVERESRKKSGGRKFRLVRSNMVRSPLETSTYGPLTVDEASRQMWLSVIRCQFAQEN